MDQREYLCLGLIISASEIDSFSSKRNNFNVQMPTEVWTYSSSLFILELMCHDSVLCDFFPSHSSSVLYLYFSLFFFFGCLPITQGCEQTVRVAFVSLVSFVKCLTLLCKSYGGFLVLQDQLNESQADHSVSTCCWDFDKIQDNTCL